MKKKFFAVTFVFLLSSLLLSSKVVNAQGTCDCTMQGSPIPRCQETPGTNNCAPGYEPRCRTTISTDLCSCECQPEGRGEICQAQHGGSCFTGATCPIGSHSIGTIDCDTPGSDDAPGEFEKCCVPDDLPDQCTCSLNVFGGGCSVADDSNCPSGTVAACAGYACGQCDCLEPTPTPAPINCVNNFECARLPNVNDCGGAGIPDGYKQHCQDSGGNIGNCCIPSGNPLEFCSAPPPDGYGGRCAAICLPGETKINRDFEDCQGALGGVPCCVPDVAVIDCANDLHGRCEFTCVEELGQVPVGQAGDYNCNIGRYCCVFDLGVIGSVSVNTPLGGSCPDNELDTAIGCIPLSSDQAVLEFFLSWAIGIAGGIAFVLIVYAGYIIITSQGNPQRLQAGKELLTAALAGIAFLVLSVIILRFIGVTVLSIPWR